MIQDFLDNIMSLETVKSMTLLEVDADIWCFRVTKLDGTKHPLQLKEGVDGLTIMKGEAIKMECSVAEAIEFFMVGDIELH